MLSFDLNWPDITREFLAYQQTAGNVTGEVFSVNCALESGSSVEVYYQKL